jgi:hypothetical protein
MVGCHGKMYLNHGLCYVAVHGEGGREKEIEDGRDQMEGKVGGRKGVLS